MAPIFITPQKISLHWCLPSPISPVFFWVGSRDQIPEAIVRRVGVQIVHALVFKKKMVGAARPSSLEKVAMAETF